MKIFRIVSNIIVAAIMAVGLIPCIASYANHALYCHGCSAHGSHPIIEMIVYSLIALLALAIFGISRLILRLWEKKADPVQWEERKKARFERSSKKWSEKTLLEKVNIILPLAVIMIGLVQCTVMLVTELSSPYHGVSAFGIYSVYLPPYILISLAAWAVCRLIKRLKNGSESAGERNSIIFAIIFIAIGFLHSLCMFAGDLVDCFTINGSFSDIVLQFAYLIPYLMIAGVIYGIGRRKAERTYKTEL